MENKNIYLYSGRQIGKQYLQTKFLSYWNSTGYLPFEMNYFLRNHRYLPHYQAVPKQREDEF